MEIYVKVDKRGRLFIPSEVRRRLGIKRVLKLRVEGRRLVLEAPEDPLDKLAELVVEAPTSEEVVEDEFERELEAKLLNASASR
ncbi:AbrB/MazE/SpoVT family DNA-binding domain-containing protein [Infirmifilum sp. NZ]|uniref:AbrB/MazE/SpoVT family DNA-binding domain-containing protein n=1 Tax=Infirmifilum sp. NZ TaxID=2926850 RepID=UPI0027A91386|nr:AbrB/MazE/SpoVT family DNA-binding domain-containing protein [Infirmifilum sp. NZ]UNQ73723.1 AbrB/MazE/SpoVT family DNA-binding domain-containing protein [Infirmifilum sp. NZ]